MEKTYFLQLPHEDNYSWVRKKQLLLNIQNSSKSQILNLQLLQHYLSETYQEKIELNNLQRYCNQLNDIQSKELWIQLMHFISGFALKIENLFQKNRINLLLSQNSDINVLTKEEICCLLANMFFFTIEHQPNSTFKQKQNQNEKLSKEDEVLSKQTNTRVIQLPSYVNMKNILTQVDGQFENNCNIQKIYCIMNYFQRIQMMSNSEQEGLLQKVVYKRKQFINNDLVEALNLNSHLLQEYTIPQLDLDNESGIQDYEDRFECIQSDFADKYVGGGVLNRGCVQEEIMFIVSPELIPSILFCERLADNEVIQISGAERFCLYRGYGANFEFDQDYVSQCQLDNEVNVKMTHYAIFDALNYRNRENDQYKWEFVLRDLIKAYLAFSHIGDNMTNTLNLKSNDLSQSQNILQKSDNKNVKNLPIITGNWGCGLFQGNVQLKLIIQWIACSLLEKRMYYCTFGNPLLNQANQIISKFQGKPLNILLKLLKDYLPIYNTQDFFTYLLSQQDS